MSIAAQLGLALHDPARLVYVSEGSGPCVLDAWRATTGLRQALLEVDELVLLDPLSFPYEQLAESHRGIPITVVLPADEDVDELVALLEGPLLQHLTPADRVVAPAAMLAALAARAVLGPVEEVTLSEGEDPLGRIHAMWRDERTVTCAASFGDFTGYRDDLITHHVLEFGAHQRSDLAMLLSVVREGDAVLDVGAHVGAFTVPLARACGPTGRLDAFEANPATVELLAENIRQNELAWVGVHHAAVTDRSGLPAVSAATTVGNTGAATADRGWDKTNATLRTIALDDWWENAGRPTIDVIKLDVEGYELLSLRGARRLLEANRPVVQVEIAEDQLAAHGTSSDAVLRLLEQFGYSFYVNGLERNRADDSFELLPRGEEPSGKPVEDVLCVVDDDRLPL